MVRKMSILKNINPAFSLAPPNSIAPLKEGIFQWRLMGRSIGCSKKSGNSNTSDMTLNSLASHKTMDTMNTPAVLDFPDIVFFLHAQPEFSIDPKAHFQPNGHFSRDRG